MATEQRLIDAEWLKTRFYAICDFYATELIHIDRIIDEIDNAPEGVLEHGRWEPYYDYFTKRQVGWICTNCSGVQVDLSNGDTDYCSNCGAQMDGGADNG